MAIDKHGAGYPTINSIYCKYSNYHGSPSKTEQAGYALAKKVQIELGH
jgi:hypothetical protein